MAAHGGQRQSALAGVLHERVYLYAEELARLTPWTPDAIETMRRRGVLKEGTHYFQRPGRGGRLLFKWSEIVKLIEGQVHPTTEAVVDAPRQRSELNVEEAASRLRRLLR